MRGGETTGEKIGRKTYRSKEKQVEIMVQKEETQIGKWRLKQINWKGKKSSGTRNLERKYINKTSILKRMRKETIFEEKINTVKKLHENM